MAPPPTPYLTLYRKYRSQTFGDLVGQEVVSQALQGAVAGGRLAHAYLFSGTRGTGKTSTARLLAKAVNCTGRDRSTAEPCNSCESCLAITAGTALDLIEIDAASNRGIDEIRELRERVHLAPASASHKIYIIDEAHMLTTEAFNALLKTLEEPPEHVVFVLCTTEAQKLPATVLGRCQHFVFRRHEESQILGRLRHIATQEGVLVDDEALAIIARSAQGSMRDAVGLLDQVISLSGDSVSGDMTRRLLGMADPELLDRLLDEALSGQARAALATLGQAYESGAELRQLVRGLLERVRDRLVAAVDGQAETERKRLAEVLDALLHLDGEVRRHAEPRFLVEATMLRIAAEGPAGSRQPVVAQGAAVLGVPGVPVVSPASVAAPPAGLTPAGITPTVAALEAAESAVAIPVPAPEPAPAPAPAPVSQPESVAAPPALTEASPLASAGLTEKGGSSPDLETRWAQFLEGLRPNVKAYLREARPLLDADCLTLSFRYGFHHNWAREHHDDIKELVSPVFGTNRLEVTLAETTIGPATRSPEEDPLVQAALRQLEGRVTKVREVKV